ncbi:MAG TPA: SAM-dependent methyltransferase [Pyrinomonadaceae bacterium]|nr:SAM-dependent methyltransferase [Pyrinomonadaceae bacterium]
MPWRHWMEAALYDEAEGYYARQDRVRWGRAGDYRTSPEWSALFPATFARCFARLYDESGTPATWTILEVGTGSGDFARDLLETCERRFPQMFSRMHYIIDERSADARVLARKRLQTFSERTQFARLDELHTLQAGIIFANEVLDAFPVHRVTMRGGQLLELYVALNQQGEFCWTTGQLSTPRLAEFFRERRITLPDGHIADVNLELEGWLKRASNKLHTGYLILVDYGAETEELYYSPERRGGTLRGFFRHRFADVLANPGEHDLTTTVDWSFLRQTAENLDLQVVQFERQDRFLLEAGILQELELRTNETLDEGERARLRVKARDMVLPGGMAESFQVLILRKK